MAHCQTVAKYFIVWGATRLRRVLFLLFALPWVAVLLCSGGPTAIACSSKPAIRRWQILRWNLHYQRAPLPCSRAAHRVLRFSPGPFPIFVPGFTSEHANSSKLHPPVKSAERRNKGPFGSLTTPHRTSCATFKF